MSKTNPTLVLTERQQRNFYAKIKTSTTHSYNGIPCQEWIATLRDGYGRFRVKSKLITAHRITWLIKHGEIPDGLCVLHRCDNRPCTEESHLFLGTNQDNVDDKESKGRGNQPRGKKNGKYTKPESTLRGDNHPARLRPERLARGERNGNASIPDANITVIFRLREQKLSLRKIAAIVGCGQSSVLRILQGKQRNHQCATQLHETMSFAANAKAAPVDTVCI